MSRSFYELLILHSVVLASYSATSQADEYELVSAGVEHTINHIRQANVEVVGQRHIDYPDHEIVELPVRIVSAFDVDRKVFRFDRTESVQYGQKSQEAAPLIVSRRSSYCRLADRSLEFEGTPSQFVNIRPLNAPVSSHTSPFDVRLFGLMFYTDIRRQTDVESVLKAHFGKSADALQSDENGNIVLTWSYQNHFKRKLWVDTLHGFTPVRHEIVKMVDPTAPQEVLISTTSWKLVDDSWVPVEASLEQHLNVYKGKETIGVHSEKYVFQILWANINKSISDRVFSIEGLDLPFGTVIVDRRADPAVLVRRVGYELPSIKVVNQTGLSTWRIVLVSGNSLLFVVLLMYFGRKWLRSRSESTVEGARN